jgi:hypothetical protein
MHHLNYAEFYITNVCNLNCNNCNRFNNFAFSGHELWSDHAEDYQQWAQLISFNHIGILGGEPFLNPSLIDWIKNILLLWPTSQVSVITNGTQLERYPELYSLLLQYKDRFYLEVTVHSIALKEKIYNELDTFLSGRVTKKFDRTMFPDHEWQRMWNIIRDKDWPDCNNANDFYNLPEWIQHECETVHNLGHQLWTDSNGVRAEVSTVTKFFNSAIIPNINKQTFTVHDSDPKKAAEICISKFCHHFSQGKLYKCAVAGLLPDFYKQFYMEVNDNDLQLFHSYQPAEPQWDNKKLIPFLNNLETGNHIDQCKFCPEHYDEIEFESGVKKIKFIKKPT